MKRFALVGNPNSGKTTLFNSLTGSTARVGNWAGVTVEKRTGSYRKLNEKIEIVDLPGIYSLSPYTSEEVISRNYILDEKPDCVINIVDATNLERNLYLTTQLLEIDVPLVVALNMSDVVRKNGDKIDKNELEKKLGVPVVEISALKEENLDELMVKSLEISSKKRVGHSIIEEGPLSHLINDVRIAFKGKNVENPLFHSVKLVELDELEKESHPDLVEMVDEFKKTFKDETFGDDFEALIADARYQYISKNYSGVLVKANKEKKEEGEVVLTKSDKIDRVLTHRIWAIPIFIVIMFLIFHFTFAEGLFFIKTNITDPGVINFFTGMGYEGMLEEAGGVAEDVVLEGIPSLGVFLQSWMGFATGSLIDLFRSFMPEGAWYTSLVCDGILTGLDMVLSFIPQILMLFLFIAILEDSGYMARIAFILDRAFRKFGLSGKAFIPMLTGFGCSVPAIMATRTLEDEKEKRRTIRLMTCFSCGAKAPIWTLLAGVGTWAFGFGDVFVFTIYIGGIALAIIYALLLKVFSKDTYVSPFIMELPAYHIPQPKNVLAHLWEKLKHYVIKAATIIAASTIVIWFLKSFSFTFQFLLLPEVNDAGETEYILHIEDSMLAGIGRVFNYLFYPLGALPGGWTHGEDGWKYSVSAITGLIAKEDVVATMAELGLDESSIELNAAGVYSFAVFNLLTIPCFAAIGAAHGEQKGKEFWITLGTWFGLSYGTALLFYWIGELYIVSLVGGILVTLALIGGVVACGFIVSSRHKKSNAMNA